MTQCGHLAGRAPVHYLLSLWENRSHESQDFLYSFNLLWCPAWNSFSPNLSVSVKGNITIIEPYLTEDTEAQRGEATCPRPHRTTGERDPKSMWDGLPQSPCLSTPPPPQGSQDFTPPTGPGGWRVGSRGTHLSCCTWQAAGLCGPRRLRREQELPNTLIIMDARAMDPIRDQEAGFFS